MGLKGWPPLGPGWVREIENWQMFADTIDEEFSLLFNSMYTIGEVLDSSPLDPNEDNNLISIIITPHEG